MNSDVRGVRPDLRPTSSETGSADPRAAGSPVSRRRLLGLAGASVAGLVGAGAITQLAIGQQQRARRAAQAAASTAEAPAFTVLTARPGTGPGDLFYTDMGDTPAPMITDAAGHRLWSTDGAKAYADLRLQMWLGRPVITWWESHSTGLAAYADGRTVVTDLAHRVLATVEAHGGVSPDEHEFLITPHGTAFIVSYVKTTVDLAKHGGTKNGVVMNGIFEEVDLVTGAVLHHWESLDHVDLAESYAGVPEDPAEPYDYFHINSVGPTPDGNVVISARHTWGLYKVDLSTGQVLWRLGGKRSDFDLPASATFAWQHDAQFEDPTTLRLFDNGTDGTTTVTDQSQLLWFSLDQTRRRATLTRRLVHPAKVSAKAMGNVQRLVNGNLLVGWGSAARISEFADDGTLLFDATLPDVSYRTYRQVWR